MKIYSISVALAPSSGASVILAQANDLSSFTFYQRGSLAEFMTFFARTVAERTQPGQRQSIEEQNNVAHVYNRGGPEQLAGVPNNCYFRRLLCAQNFSIAVMITDQEYPVRPAFSLLSKLLDDFVAKVPQSSFNNPSSISFPEAQTYIQKYQDPRQADTIMRVQQELDETKIVLVRSSRVCVWMCFTEYNSFKHKTIESVLQRGEKLDSLVERSNALSAQSKMFYKTAKKVNGHLQHRKLKIYRHFYQQNSCCIMM